MKVMLKGFKRTLQVLIVFAVFFGGAYLGIIGSHDNPVADKLYYATVGKGERRVTQERSYQESNRNKNRIGF